MDFKSYQQKAAKTIQRYTKNDDANNYIPFLGIIGEAGSVLTELKKKLRDGDSYINYDHKLKEELGDVLWYVAAISTQHKFDLNEIAELNVVKIEDRFTDLDILAFKNYDDNYPEIEKFPREFEINFIPYDENGKKKVKIIGIDGEPIGDPLTDNTYDDDGYRFHDIFHYGYIAFLGWSPVVRSLLKKKRKSDSAVDENEDGARAKITEELISLFVYNYANDHQLFKYSHSVDTDVLKAIQRFTRKIEIKDCTTKQWEVAIINSYKVFNELRQNNGGRVLVSLKNRKLIYLGKN